MSPQLNIRLVMFFFMAAAMLNIANYTIYSLQSREQHKYQSSKPISSSNSQRLTSRATIWDALITCTSIVNSQKLTTTHETSKILTESTKMTTEEYSADVSFEYTESNTAESVMTTMNDLCPEIPPGLGPITAPEDLIDSAKKNTFGEIFKGGYYKTSECRPRQSVAIIVPHRGDKRLLKVFLHYLHSFLIKQQTEYQIYIVENANQSMPLNRGQLFNIGFSEVQKQRRRHWPCLILHEAYLTPMDSRNLYRCSWYPKQLVAAVQVSTKLMLPKIGGVIAISPNLYSIVNGFSNLDWKYDAEFSDFYRRILLTNFTVERSDVNIGKYRYMKYNSTDSMHHAAQQTSTETPQNIADGLFNLSFKAKVEHFKLYTHINVSAHSVQAETMQKLNSSLGRGLHRTTPSGHLKQTVYIK